MISMIKINDINDSRLNLFSKISEVELSHFYEPKPGLFLAESMKVLERALAAGYEPLCALVEERVYSDVSELFNRYSDRFEENTDISVYIAPFEALKQITGYHMTGGVICVMKRKLLPSVEEICLGANTIAVLENVVNPTNIGAIFRNAAALGVDAVLLSPGCCDPLYKRAIRVSMGTVFQIPWTFVQKKGQNGLDAWPLQTMDYLQRQGFAKVAMALDDKAISINNTKLKAEAKKAILLGTEGTGLEAETLRLCDYTVMIPMSHEVDSLNVAAASALAFWELVK